LSEPKTLVTWTGRATFSYVGSVKEGTRIFFATNPYPIIVSAIQYQQMLNHFKGKVVELGTVKNLKKRPSGSLGEWIGKEVGKTAVASYVAAILVHEGYARKRRNMIEFF
jgi:hypothetical protein